MKVGEEAPDFELPDQTGTKVRLSELLENGPVVLFFYPAAMTYGCTKESCHFRDLESEFAAAGGQRIGISADPVDKQKRFDDKHGLGFPLLSDSERVVADQFGVKRGLGVTPVKRSTFVIDRDRKVRAVISSELKMNVHADKALETLRELA